VVVLIYLLLGMVFDGLSMMVMTLPVVFPLLTGLGYDAVWLGVVITIMIEVGMLTPPVGMNLFVLVGILQAPGEFGPSLHRRAALLAAADAGPGPADRHARHCHLAAVAVLQVSQP
jgi:hypothetical protein